MLEHSTGRLRTGIRDGFANCGDFAERLSGSSDLYEADGRDPFASINFITAHDGFTLRDLTRRLIRLRREHKVFRRDSFLRGREVKGSGLPDVWWFRADGRLPVAS